MAGPRTPAADPPIWPRAVDRKPLGRRAVCPGRTCLEPLRGGPLVPALRCPSSRRSEAETCRQQLMASNRRVRLLWAPAERRDVAAKSPAAPRRGRFARRPRPSSAHRRRGRLRPHRRGPTADMTDRRGDPFRCGSATRRDEEFGNSFCRRSMNGRTLILAIEERFSQSRARFQFRVARPRQQAIATFDGQ
jgi:hypothetical protein